MPSDHTTWDRYIIGHCATFECVAADARFSQCAYCITQVLNAKRSYAGASGCDMSFDQRFQLAEAIPAEMGKQDCMLSGRQLATDRKVTIHLLAGGYCDANSEVMHAIA